MNNLGTDTSLKGSDYRGCQTKTRGGYTCEAWDNDNAINYINSERVDGAYGTETGNYCRNPSSSGTTIWCYTTSNKLKWDYCDPVSFKTVPTKFHKQDADYKLG